MQQAVYEEFSLLIYGNDGNVLLEKVTATEPTYEDIETSLKLKGACRAEVKKFYRLDDIPFSDSVVVE